MATITLSRTQLNEIVMMRNGVPIDELLWQGILGRLLIAPIAPPCWSTPTLQDPREPLSGVSPELEATEDPSSEEE